MSSFRFLEGIQRRVSQRRNASNASPPPYSHTNSQLTNSSMDTTQSSTPQITAPINTSPQPLASHPVTEHLTTHPNESPTSLVGKLPRTPPDIHPALRNTTPPETTERIKALRTPLDRSENQTPTGPPTPESGVKMPFKIDPEIKSNSVPQWLWSNGQCRTYLYHLFHTLLNQPHTDAIERASKFKGFGPTMFSTTYSGWMALYGTWEGDGIYSLIFVNRYKEGAMPRDLTYAHFENLAGTGTGTED